LLPIYVAASGPGNSDICQVTAWPCADSWTIPAAIGVPEPFIHHPSFLRPYHHHVAPLDSPRTPYTRIRNSCAARGQGVGSDMHILVPTCWCRRSTTCPCGRSDLSQFPLYILWLRVSSWYPEPE